MVDGCVVKKKRGVFPFFRPFDRDYDDELMDLGVDFQNRGEALDHACLIPTNQLWPKIPVITTKKSPHL